MSQYVYYLAEHSFGGRMGKRKVAYIERADYWRRYHRFSGSPIHIPIEVAYHLHLSSQLMPHIFEISDSSVTDSAFIGAGFIRDESVARYVEQTKLK